MPGDDRRIGGLFLCALGLGWVAFLAMTVLHHAGRLVKALRSSRQLKTATGRGVAFVGLCVLVWGVSQVAGAYDTQTGYRGAAVQENSDIQRIGEIVTTDGLIKMGLGFVMLCAGERRAQRVLQNG